jgi:stage II sporulation protein M
MKRILMKVWDVKADTAAVPSLVFLCVCFVIGGVAGTVAAANGGDSTQLAASASEYTSLADFSLGLVFLKILQYPVAVILSGLCVFGAVLIPFIVIVRGFFLLFAVTTFVRLFGAGGLLYSLTLFGIQCLFVLPCIILLGAQGLISTGLLFSMAAGRGRKISGPILTSGYFLRILICLVVLLAGSLAETYITPYFVSLALKKILK